MPDVLWKVGRLSPSFAEVPLSLHYDRKPGASKMNVGRTIRRTLALIAKRRFGINSLTGAAWYTFARMPIPVFRPSYDHREEEAVIRVLRSGWIGLGPVTEQFEQAFAKKVGAKYAVALNSATAALHIAIKLLGVGPGDEVLVPTMTFVSTAMVADYEHAGAGVLRRHSRTLDDGLRGRRRTGGRCAPKRSSRCCTAAVRSPIRRWICR